MKASSAPAKRQLNLEDIWSANQPVVSLASAARDVRAVGSRVQIPTRPGIIASCLVELGWAQLIEALSGVC